MANKFSNDIHKMASWNLIIVGKVLSIPVTVSRELTVDKFLRYLGVVKQKLFARRSFWEYSQKYFRLTKNFPTFHSHKTCL